MTLILALMFGTITSLLVLIVGDVFQARAWRARRIAQVLREKAAWRWTPTEAALPFRMRLRKATVKLLSIVKFVRANDAKEVRDRLHRAGFQGNDSVSFYSGFKLVLPIIVGGIAALIQGFTHSDRSWMALLFSILAPALASSFAPDLYIKFRTSRRDMRIVEAFPDALDIMVVCAEAGLSMDVTIQRAAKEIRLSSKDLSSELLWLVNALRLQPSRRTAFEDFARRLNLPGMHTFVNTVIQTERYGTPVAEAIRAMASEMRSERLLRAEERAARLGATLTIPLIVFIMPALFVLLIGPAAIRALELLSR